VDSRDAFPENAQRLGAVTAPRWLTMKPGVSFARTGLCPQRSASASSASPTQGAVKSPSTTSTTFISGTGLKK